MGSAVGLKNMTALLEPGGVFYLSVPIGVERVEFNAHRVFDPLRLVQLATDSGLNLQEFAWFVHSEGLVHSSNPELDMRKLSSLRYALGIFTFQKN
jgi:hypothetical protein